MARDESTGLTAPERGKEVGMTNTTNDTGAGMGGSGMGGSGMGAGMGGPGRRGRFFDDLAGMAGGAFSVMAGARAEIEAAVKAQVEIVAQKLELVRREDLDAALEVARRAREESSALALRVEALEAKLGVSPKHGAPAAEGSSSVEPAAVDPNAKEDPTDPASLA
jgi:BMFP domain-containing protein YqiC